MLAGAPKSQADLSSYLGTEYHPLNDLQSDSDVDRYAAVKSLPYRDDPRDTAIAALEKLIPSDPEERVVLEASGAAVALGSAMGEEKITEFIWDNDDRPDLRMEAVLLLTEMGNSGFTHDLLNRVASEDKFRGDELRQCAVWGLGKAGLRSYANLLRFIDDPEENVALHAVAAFGNDTPRAVVDELVLDLIHGDARRAPAASEVLRNISNDEVFAALIEATKADPTGWLLATLGRLSPTRLREDLGGDPLLEVISPMLLLSDPENWLSSETAQADVSFLLSQSV